MFTDPVAYASARARGELAVLLRPFPVYPRPVPDDEPHKEDGMTARSSLERRVDRIEAYLEAGMNVNLDEWEADQERSREAGAAQEQARAEAAGESDSK